MKRIIVIVFATVFCTYFAMAQRHEVGFKLGYDWSLTYQYNLSEKNSIDVGVNFPGKALYPFKDNGLNNLGAFGTQVWGFYLWNFQMPVENMSWYVGPGLYQGFAAKEDLFAYLGSFNGKIGIKYLLADTPLAFTFDWAPGIAFSNHDLYGHKMDSQIGFTWWTFGAGVKYTF